MVKKIRQTITRNLDAEEHDYYATSPRAALDLLRVEPQISNIWEPACGAGHLSGVFYLRDRLGMATDIINRGAYRFDGLVDFLKYDGPQWDGDIVTNPPYSLTMQFVIKALEMVKDGRYVAMLLPLTFLESAGRFDKIFSKTPFVRMHAYVQRLQCAKNGDFELAQQSMRSYAWYIWQKGNYGVPEVHWIRS